MVETEQAQWIVPTTGAKTLPIIEILTGRGFITGKSGSGKSNTASVIAEELLENNYNLLVVDPEGEYYGLKEKYEILHVGNDELCDVQVTADHAEQIAEITLERNMPVILDVSDYLDADESEALIANTIRELFRLEKDVRKPFLVMIEEMQEYLPQQGGSDELAELLERVAKRGRKRGLGMLGMSQRPSSVDKNFITQCDWMVWHRLTWQNDVNVVQNVLGSDIAEQVEDLETGEGFLMTDWDESVERVQFKRKRTHDAGATPGLESYERPDLKSVSRDLVRDLTASGSQTPVTSTDAETSTSGTSPTPSNRSETVEPTSAAAGSLSLEEVIDDADDLTAGEAPGFTPGTLPAAVIENLPDSMADAELDELDDGDVRRLAEALWRRNRVLEDEVTELRSILETVSVPTDGGRSTAARPAAGQPTAQSPARRRAVDARQHPPQFDGTKPVPPAPPEKREGIAGNLVELVYLVMYVVRVLLYRLHVGLYRIRYRRDLRAE